MGAGSSNLHPETAKVQERRFKAVLSSRPTGLFGDAGAGTGSAAGYGDLVSSLFGLKPQLSQGAQSVCIYDQDLTQYHEFTSRHWNLDAHSFPLIVVRIASDDDAAACVKFAVSKKLPICVVSGYHSATAIHDGAFVIDTVLRKKCAADAETKTMVCESGARIEDFDRELKRTGLVCPTGTNPFTGITGLTLAGGFGYLQHLYGLTCDCLLCLHVVLADGSIVNVSSEQNADLFWLCRGSGFCPGVILRLTFKCFDFKNPFVSHTTITDLTLGFGRAAAKKAFIREWEAVQRSCSDQTTSHLILACGAPAVPTIWMSFGATEQDVNDGAETKHEDLKKLQTLAAGSWTRPSKFLWEDFFDGTQRYLIDRQKPGYWYQSFFALKSLSDDILDILLKYTNDDYPDATTALLLFSVKGAVLRADRNMEKTCFAHREGYEYMVLLISGWDDQRLGPAGKAACREWYLRMRGELAAKGAMEETAHALSTTKRPTAGDGTVIGSGSEGPSPKLGGGYFVNAPASIRQKLKSITEKYDAQAVFVRNRSVGYEETAVNSTQ